MSLNQIGNKGNGNAGFGSFDKLHRLDNKFKQLQAEKGKKGIPGMPDKNNPAAEYLGSKEAIPGENNYRMKSGRNSRAEFSYVDGEANLSEAARKYLNKLRETYTNFDFTIASYSSDEEADEIMRSNPTDKEFSALIDPETLEKMAADAEVAEHYESILANAHETFGKMLEELGEDTEAVDRMSISVDKEGSVSYSVTMKNDYSLLFKEMRESQKKQAEESKDAAKENAGFKLPPHGRPKNKPEAKTFTASSINELKEKVTDYLKEIREKAAQAAKTSEAPHFDMKL